MLGGFCRAIESEANKWFRVLKRRFEKTEKLFREVFGLKVLGGFCRDNG